jgi:hypothetical protein
MHQCLNGSGHETVDDEEVSLSSARFNVVGVKRLRATA